MEAVRTGGRNHAHLTARGATLRIRAEILRLHLEFLNGIERNVQTHVLSLFLVVNRGRVNTVKREIVIVQSMSGKANRSLIARAIIDGPPGRAL
jgi:hypothetical protein